MEVLAQAATPRANVHDLDAGAARVVAGAKASKVQSAKPSEVEVPTRAGEVSSSQSTDVPKAKVEEVEEAKATETVDSNSNDYVPFADQMSEADAQRYEQWTKYAEAGISPGDRVCVDSRWAYVCLTIDLFNREIIGLAVGWHKTTELVKKSHSKYPLRSHKSEAVPF